MRAFFHAYQSCLLCMCPEHTFGPCLCTGYVNVYATGSFVQIIDYIVIVIGAVIVHVFVLQELWPKKK